MMKNVLWEKRESIVDFIARKNRALAIYEADGPPLSLDAFVAEYMRTLEISRPEMHRRLKSRLAHVGKGGSREAFISIVRIQVQSDYLARTPSDWSFW